MTDRLAAPATAGVILAGGRSSRMAGEDKALKPLAGKPLITHVIERLAPQVKRLAVNSNADPEAFRRFGLPVIPDRLPGFRGPLAGMHAALAAFPDARVLTIAVDLPLLPPDLLARLADGWDGRRCRYVACDGQHRLAILWPPGLASALEAWLARGESSVRSWLGRHGEPVTFPPEICADLDLNLNTPEAFAEAERRLR